MKPTNPEPRNVLGTVFCGLLVLLGAVPGIQARQPLDEQGTPFDASDNYAICDEGYEGDAGYCSVDASADHTTGSIRISGNATTRPRDGFSTDSGIPEDRVLAATMGGFRGNLTLDQPSDAVLVEVVFDVQAAAGVGGGPGRAQSMVAYFVYVTLPDEPCCWLAAWGDLLVTAQKDGGYWGFGPREVPLERRTASVVMRGWEDGQVPAGSYHVWFEMYAFTHAYIEDHQGTSIFGYTLSDNPPTEPSYAWHEATASVVSMRLGEPPRKDLIAKTKDPGTNQTYTAVAPYEAVALNPGCYAPCTEPAARAEDGSIAMRVEFGETPSTSRTRYEGHSVKFRHRIDVPLAADSLRFTANLRLEDVRTATTDPTGTSNAWAFVDATAYISTQQCYVDGCAGPGYVERILALSGNCGQQCDELPDTITNATISLQAGLGVTDGVAEPPGTYVLIVDVRAWVKPNTVGDVAISGAMASIDAVLESLTLEVDPAPWPPA